MNELQALTAFLKRFLVKRRERYIEFVAKPKTQRKFLDAIYHDLKTCFDHDAAVKQLPDDILDQPAYRFAPPRQFGIPMSTLRELAESCDDSCLAVAHDGRSGIYRPEAMIDRQMFFHWRSS